MKSNYLPLSVLCLTVALAACGTTPTTPIRSQTPVAAPTHTTSLAAKLQKSSLSAQAVEYWPDLKTLARTSVDNSSSQIIIGYKDDAQLQRFMQHFGASLDGQIPELRAALLTLPVTLSGEKTIQALSSSGSSVCFVTSNSRTSQLGRVPSAQVITQSETRPPLQTQAISHDPLFAKQWWLSQVKAEQVRDLATGKGITVGIVDEDFDRLHEDLKSDGKIVTGIDTTNFQPIAPDAPLLSGAHGSGSAGIIAARTGNKIGGESIAPDATLMPVRIFNQDGYTGDFEVAYGLIWAVNHGAKILNNSWGGGGYSLMLKEAVDYALAHEVVIVASAGNDYRDLHNGIEAYPGVISVGASTGDDKKASFSNLGPRVDVYAPGDNGLTTYIDESLSSPARESSYGLFGGTSMAGPVVAGAAALLLDRANQLKMTLTPYQVKRLLSDTGDAMNDARSTDAKRLNLVKALNFTATTVPADGGYLAVQVSDLVTGDLLSRTDVILTPLSGQNKNLDYIAQTSSGVVVDNLNNSEKSPGNPQLPQNGLGTAIFFGIEPGEYEVKVSGPGQYDDRHGGGGVRSSLLGRVNVKGGIQNTQVLKYQHQVDQYELFLGSRNGSPASAYNFSYLPEQTWADPRTTPLLGGVFDNTYPLAAFPGGPTDDKVPDTDYYKFKVPAGKSITISTYGALFGSTALAAIDLVDADDHLIPDVDYALFPTGNVDSAVHLAADEDRDVYVKIYNTKSTSGVGAWYGFVVLIQ